MYSIINIIDIEDELQPNSLEARHLEEGSEQDDNDIRLPLVRVGKGPRTIVANGKRANSKLSLILTKLVEDELLLDFLEARNLKDSNNKDDNNIKLSLVRSDKRPKTTAANGKPASSKLSSVLTRLTLRMGQDVRAKKVLTLKTG